MKKLELMILALTIIFNTFIFANTNPFADGENIDDGDVSGEIFEDKDDAMLYLDSIQKSFWNENRKKSDNNINITFQSNETHMIRTRYAMNTTFIFDNDKIASVILGDSVGFELKELGKGKFDLSNILTIKPKMIGIDTNLIVIGESGRVYQFYLFSTKYTNSRNPSFVVFISAQREQIGELTMENLEAKDKEEYKKELEKLQSKSAVKEPVLEVDNGDFIDIGEGTNKISIKKSDMEYGYKQMPRKENLFSTSKEAIKLMAKEIFNDKKWTYFKYDASNAKSKFPEIYRIVDGYDNPINYRIVGDYIIAETISDKWTLRLGNEYVCVRKQED